VGAARARDLLARRGRILAIFLLNLALVAGARQARALHVQAPVDIVGQAYQYLRGDGEVIDRRRVNTWLGLNVLDLGDDRTNRWSFVSSMRLDTDAGVTSGSQIRYDGRTATDLSPARVNLMYGYLEGRGLLGVAGVRVGRMLLADELDYLVVDGARVRVDATRHVGVELLGGLEGRNDFGSVVTSPQTIDGVTTPGMQPLFGGGLYLRGIEGAAARIGYRRTLVPGGAIAREVAGGAAHGRLSRWLHASAVYTWDFFHQRTEEARLGARARIAEAFDVDLEYWYLLPTFHADSIFNVFSIQPTNDWRAKLRFRAGRDLAFHLGSTLRLFRNETTTAGGALFKDATGAPLDVDGKVRDLGVLGGASWVPRDGVRLLLDLSHTDGYGGRQTFFDLLCSVDLLGRRLRADGRLTLVNWEDQLQPNLNGTSWGGAAGLTHRLARIATLHGLVELNTGRLQPIQSRALLIASLDFLVGGGAEP